MTTSTESTEPFDCPYCEGRFARERYRNLHLGQTHPDRLDADQREAYATAREEEVADLRLFRLKVLALLVLVYFGFLIVYAFAL